MKKIFPLLAFALAGPCLFGANSISISALSVPAAQVIHKSADISGVVDNTGNQTIFCFTLTWNDGSVERETTFRGLSILPGNTYAFTLPAAYTPAEARKYVISVTVKNPNGIPDADMSDNTASQESYGLIREAVKRAVAEEATGTWCGWCPRGAVYMEQMRDTYGDDFIGIAVHNSDPMVVGNYNSAIVGLISGFPSAMVDRASTIDPSALPTQVANHLNYDPVADIEVFGTYDDASKTLHVDIKAEFLSDHSGLNYRLNCILTEDSVTGTTSGYNQENYYSGGGNGTMGGYESLPNPVPADQMVYQFVARKIVDGWAGTENSVPTDVTAGQVVVSHYDIVLGATWDINNLNVIGLLTDHDNTRDKIINGNKTRLTDLNAYTNVVNTLPSDLGISPNPANTSATVSGFMRQSEDVRISISNMQGDLVSVQDFGLQSGNMALPVNTSGLAQGIYLVTVSAGTDSRTEKIVIVH